MTAWVWHNISQRAEFHYFVFLVVRFTRTAQNAQGAEHAARPLALLTQHSVLALSTRLVAALHLLQAEGATAEEEVGGTMRRAASRGGGGAPGRFRKRNPILTPISPCTRF